MHGGIPGDGVSMIDGMRIGNMYLSSNLTNMSLSALIYDEVNLSFSGQIAGIGDQRRDHERDSEVGRQLRSTARCWPTDPRRLSRAAT